MSSAQKDIIYIDIDDEITSIIEKVQSSSHKIVALVLPKRAAMLQSIVNMKLLKRAGDTAKKKIVLITSEAGLLPLAGAVGLHAAKTLQSRPEIPVAPSVSSATIDAEISEEVSAGDLPVDSTKTVGELAGDDEPIEVDTPEDTGTDSKESTTKSKKKSGKKLKIPNFNKFRTRLIIGLVLIILLVAGWYVAAFVLPRATITIETRTTTVSSDVDFVVRPGLEDIDEELSIVPGVSEELRQTDTEKTDATGEKNIGDKATGTVVIYNCSLLDLIATRTRTVPAGTGVSSGDLTFILTEDVEVEPSNHSSLSGDDCNKNRPSDEVDVVAQNPGTDYNVDEREYSVSDYPAMVAEGSEMTGGTDKIVSVVRQKDVNDARDRLIERNKEVATQELKDELSAAGYIPLEGTFQSGDPDVGSSPNVGAEADQATITATIVYTMLGVNREGLHTLIANDVAEDIDTERQTILDDGLDDATFRVTATEPSGDARVNVRTFVTAGPELDEASIKAEIKGTSRSDTERIIKDRPGIRDTIIDYNPFWVFSTPRNEDKIDLIIQSVDEPVDEEEIEEEDAATDEP